MEIIDNDAEIERYMKEALKENGGKPNLNRPLLNR